MEPRAAYAPSSPAVARSGRAGCPACSTVVSCWRCPTRSTSRSSGSTPATARHRRGPGRAIDLIDGAELQVATIGPGPSHEEQSTAVRGVAAALGQGRALVASGHGASSPCRPELDLRPLIERSRRTRATPATPGGSPTHPPGRGWRRRHSDQRGRHTTGLPLPRHRTTAVRPLQRAGGAGRQLAGGPPGRHRLQPPLATAVLALGAGCAPALSRRTSAGSSTSDVPTLTSP